MLSLVIPQIVFGSLLTRVVECALLADAGTTKIRLAAARWEPVPD